MSFKYVETRCCLTTPYLISNSQVPGGCASIISSSLYALTRGATFSTHCGNATKYQSSSLHAKARSSHMRPRLLTSGKDLTREKHE